jgi:DNA gyrase subunit B
VVDNSIDEAMAGFCDKVIIILNSDGSVSVLDNGRGIPVDKHKTSGKSALETVLTTLHAGGKFGEGGYKVSGGLHGVGVSVVNALSEWVKAEIKRDNKIYFQEYHRGKAVEEIKVIGESKETGTTITFMPDAEIFKDRTFSWSSILTHCRQQAYLTKGVMIMVKDERKSKEIVEEELKVEENVAATEEDVADIEKNMRTGRGGEGAEEEVIVAGPQQYSFYLRAA